LTGFPGPAWRDESVKVDDSTGLPHLPPPLTDAEKVTLLNGLEPSGPISPVTGRRACSSPWPDGALACSLLVGGGFLTRWWWRQGINVRL
jgi:hypothetical protein